MATFRYKRDGLPLSLIRIHDDILKSTVDYFEKAKEVRKGIKQARKAVKQALKFAKKKNTNPGIKIGMAREALEGIREELSYTRKSIAKTYSNLDEALDRIQNERLMQPLFLIDKAHELFREKQVEKGMETLKKSLEELDKKVLVKTRTALFAGTSNQVTALKHEIKEYKQRQRLGKKEKKNP
jgi:hypothetical protein